MFFFNSCSWPIPHSTLSRLQLVQNAAARLLTGTKKRDHISPVFASLHWLPIKFRVDFKICIFLYKALHKMALGYICDLIQPYTAWSSCNQFLLFVPHSRWRKIKRWSELSLLSPKTHFYSLWCCIFKTTWIVFYIYLYIYFTWISFQLFCFLNAFVSSFS